MKRFLLPIDGTERSYQTVTWVMENYGPKDVDLTLVMTADRLAQINLRQKYTSATDYMMNAMKKNAYELIEKGYSVHFDALFGDPGEEITKYAKNNSFDGIIMTKSTKKNWIDAIGSVTTYVVKYSPVLVMIIPEVLPGKD